MVIIIIIVALACLTKESFKKHSQEGLDGSVGLQSICQLLGPADGGHHAEVQVELRERLRLRHAATHAAEVPVRQLAAAHRQQPHAVLLQTVAYVFDLRAGQRLSRYLNRARQHFGGVKLG